MQHHQMANASELSAILDGLAEGFYSVDRDWRVKHFNNRASGHFRREPGEVIGGHLWTLFPGAVATGLGRQFLRAMETRRAVASEAMSVTMKGRRLSYRLFPLGTGLGVAWQNITHQPRTGGDAALDALGFGILKLSPEGQIDGANAAANEILALRDGLHLSGGVRAAAKVDDDRLQAALQQAAAAAIQGQCFARRLAIGRPSGRRAYVVQVSVTEESAPGTAPILVTIVDADRDRSIDEGDLVALFGLTIAEARVAALLAKGMSVSAIAAYLGIGFETARTHLARVRSKTRTSSQIDLVRLLVQSLHISDWRR
jgi:DNA-binding CsgD family transcriptional regulator